MATVIVLGAGISGHTAALVLRRKLGKKHDVVVVSPNSNYQWVPSNIWVGVGRMKPEQVKFKLRPVYKKMKIRFEQALARSIHPDGSAEHEKAFVGIEYTDPEKQGETAEIEYDYLINATGPKLNFAGTEGLGPDQFTNSVCTYSHAAQAWKNLDAAFEKMKKGEKQRFLIGTGHALATCQGAAFEYALNIAFEIRTRGLQDKAEITWISNEYELGDFGMSGAFVKRGGYITPTKVFTESIFAENGIKWIKQAGVYKVEQGKAHYETLEGEKHTAEFDFAMLIPGFAGVGIKAYNRKGGDITEKLFAPNGLMKVDADYTPKDFEDWSVDDWPETYQNPLYDNIFASGIAFAPPHAISKPTKSKNGTPIFPTPPRTGMPSGVIGKVVAQNIANQILKNTKDFKHKASMGHMGAACIVSAGYGIRKGTAATMTVFPIVPNWDKYPDWGRDISYTIGEAGLAGHWVKLLLHYLFLYKAKAKPMWWLIPE